MRRRLLSKLPPALALTGLVLLLGTVAAWWLTRPGSRHAIPPPARTTAPAPTPTTTQPTTTAAPVPVTPVQMSWNAAGGLVWHTGDVDPAVLGRALRQAGFGWVAVQIADGENPTPIGEGWIRDFRAASGLPVGGWSVLRDQPSQEAELAARLVAADGLDFYIADAEAEYGYTSGDEASPQRYGRSQQFVAAFRATFPTMPAALTSYCRPDQHDLDWRAWSGAGFVFLPQAYVEAEGAAATPAACAAGAAAFFPRSAVHPILGIFPGTHPTPTPDAYRRMLAAAGVHGFSIYPAEDLPTASEPYLGLGTPAG
jgi:hypothetical protein